VPGAAGPGRDLSYLLLASPDDYLLELERKDIETAWVAAHPAGEIHVLDPDPGPGALVRELSAPSLFASARLLVVPSARTLTAKRAGAEEATLLAEGLDALSEGDATLLLAGVTDGEPAGPLAEVVRARGEVRWLPLPPPPKPWEEVRLSADQRRVLEGIVRRTAPSLLEHQDLIEALFEHFGFRPRELAQAAQRVALAGELSAESVRAQLGPGECSLRQAENLLLSRGVAGMARFLAVLSAGGELVGWRDERIPPDRAAATVAATVARLLRQALALRGHVAAVGLTAELDSGRCAARGWYQPAFKKRIQPRLAEHIEASPDSPVARMTPWQLHRNFRLAAAYDDTELLGALGALDHAGIERERGETALASLSSVLLDLVTPR
jgi:hypothetical protein